MAIIVTGVAALAVGVALLPGSTPRAGVPEGDATVETLDDEEPRSLAEESAALAAELREGWERQAGAPGKGAPRLPSLSLYRAVALRAYSWRDSSDLRGLNGEIKSWIERTVSRAARHDATPERGRTVARSGLRPGTRAGTHWLLAQLRRTQEESLATLRPEKITEAAAALAGIAEVEGDPGTFRIQRTDVDGTVRGFTGLDLRSGHPGFATESFLEAYVATADTLWFHAAAAGARALKRQASDGLSAWKTPYPDGTAWAALALARWGSLAHDDSALALGRALVERMQLLRPMAAADPEAVDTRAAALLAVELLEHPAPMAYIIGDRGSQELRAFHRAALAARRPERLISVHDRGDSDLLYPPHEGKTVVYVCSGEACAAPVTTVKEMVELLETFARPEPTRAPAGDATAPR